MECCVLYSTPSVRRRKKNEIRENQERRRGKKEGGRFKIDKR